MDFDLVEDDIEIFEIFAVGFPRRIYDRPDLFHRYDEIEFFKRFRLSKQSVLHFLPNIEADLERPYNRNNLVTPINQLLITLMYYSSNSHQINISDIGHADVSCINRIIRRVSRAIAALYNQYIKFPEGGQTINNTKNMFFDIAEFPNVIGAIDGTHIRIRSPGQADAEVFRNRKNYFSLNVQAICNANLEITNLVARWPGSAHDATIFNNSNIRRRFENGEFPNCTILADGAYPIQEYMLTPLENPIFQPEITYNTRHIRTRNVIERLFGVWKRRFPILAYGCRLRLTNVLPVVVATAVLYNFAKRNGEPEPPLPNNINEHDFQVMIQRGNIPNMPPMNNNVLPGFAQRENLIWNYFVNL